MLYTRARESVLVLFVLGASCVFAIGWLWFPRELRFSDEAYYVSTALKSLESGSLSSATHLPEDVLAHGTEHRPVHMPAYFVALALWLSLFPDPASVLVLNGLLFVAAVVLVHRSFLAGKPPGSPESLAGFAVLLGLPLGIAYAHTAMMESFVLFVGALATVAWCATDSDPRRLYALYATAALAVLTRETLLWIPVAFAVTRPRALARRHVALWRLGSGPRIGLGALALVLGALVAMSSVGRGHTPGFLARLEAAPDPGTRVALAFSNLAGNLAASFRWQVFPHDLLYPYEAALLAATALLALRGARRPSTESAPAILVLWLLTAGTVLIFYDTTLWRAHRVLDVCVLLSTGLVLRWIALEVRSSAVKVALLAWLLTLNAGLAHGVGRHFILRRTAPLPVHPLSGVARPGDLLLSREDFSYLLANPRGELIWEIPERSGDLRRVLEIARPEFAILPGAISLEGLGYESPGGADAGRPGRQQPAGLRLWRRVPAD